MTFKPRSFHFPRPACFSETSTRRATSRVIATNSPPRRRVAALGVSAPSPFTDHACAEAAYALDVLKADGVVLLGSTEGTFVGDRNLDELMAELDRRNTIVFVHPNLHKTTSERGLSTPTFLVEFLCDTTRAATNLILSLNCGSL